MKVELFFRASGALCSKFTLRQEGDNNSIRIVEDGFPMGTCRLHERGDGTAKIERVCVLQEYRGKGIGLLASGG